MHSSVSTHWYVGLTVTRMCYYRFVQIHTNQEIVQQTSFEVFVFVLLFFYLFIFRLGLNALNVFIF